MIDVTELEKEYAFDMMKMSLNLVCSHTYGQKKIGPVIRTEKRFVGR